MNITRAKILESHKLLFYVIIMEEHIYQIRIIRFYRYSGNHLVDLNNWFKQLTK